MIWEAALVALLAATPQLSWGSAPVLDPSREWKIGDFSKLLAVSPDGSEVYSTDDFCGSGAPGKGKIDVWSVQGEYQGSIDGFCRIIAFSRDGKKILSFGGDRLHVLDGDARRSISNWRCTPNGLLPTFSPDGAKVISSCGRPTDIYFWDASTGKKLLSWKGAEVMLSQDGTKVLRILELGTEIWDLSSGRMVAVWKVPRGKWDRESLSPDGTRVLVQGDSEGASGCSLIDILTGREVALLRGHCGDFSPDGSRIVTAGSESSIGVWDGVTGQSLATWVGPSAPVKRLAFSSDGTKVVSMEARRIGIWDAENGRSLATLVSDEDLGQLRKEQDKSLRIEIIYRPSYHASTASIRLLDLHSGRELARWGSDQNGWCGISPDGTRLLAVSQSADTAKFSDGTWTSSGELWDLVELKHLSSLTKGGYPEELAFVGSGAQAVSSGRGLGAKSWLWDIAGGRVLADLGADAKVAVSENGATLASSALMDKNIRRWDLLLISGTDSSHLAQALRYERVRLNGAMLERGELWWTDGEDLAGPLDVPGARAAMIGAGSKGGFPAVGDIVSVWANQELSKFVGHKPEAPKELAQQKYESSAAFHERVNRLKAAFEDQGRKYQQRLREGNAWVTERLPDVSAKAFLLVFGKPKVSKTVYDPDKESYTVQVVGGSPLAGDTVFNLVFDASIGGEEARALDEAIQKADVSIVFSLAQGRFVIRDARFRIAGKAYAALPASNSANVSLAKIAFAGQSQDSAEAVGAGQISVQYVNNPEIEKRVKELDSLKAQRAQQAQVTALEEQIRVLKKESAPHYASDVDTPSYRGSERPESYAVVVGVEKYSSDLPRADFAERDAQAVREHLIALGYPERNIRYLKGSQATKGKLEGVLEDWLPRVTNQDSSVFFYFSGHGAPDPSSSQAYLVPWDGEANLLEKTAYSLKRLYASLTSLKVRHVTVVLDSCFSGSGARSVLPHGARPLITKVETAIPAGGRLVVLAAASATEITGTLDDKGHGVFTYFFLKGLNEVGAKGVPGTVTANGLFNYLKPKVQDAASRQNRDQTPILEGEVTQEIARFGRR